MYLELDSVRGLYDHIGRAIRITVCWVDGNGCFVCGWFHVFSCSKMGINASLF